MRTVAELEEARPDVEAMLAEVLGSILDPDGGDPPARPGARTPSGGGAVTAHLAVLDESDGGLLGVRVRADADLARILAGRMFGVPEPGTDDLLDAVGELGNIAAGGVKALFFRSARLSLPQAAVQLRAGRHVADPGEAGVHGDAHEPPAVTMGVEVGGAGVELTLVPGDPPHASDLTWPPVGTVPDPPLGIPREPPHEPPPADLEQT